MSLHKLDGPHTSILPIRNIVLTFYGKLAQMLGFKSGVSFETPKEDIIDYQTESISSTPVFKKSKNAEKKYVSFHIYEDTILNGEAVMYEAPNLTDINAAIYNIFVYSDIVDYQLVGDSYVLLLKIVHIEGPSNQMITRTYDRPHYIRLCKSHIDSIKISLKDDQNWLIPSAYGKVIVKLHFRLVKQYFKALSKDIF